MAIAEERVASLGHTLVGCLMPAAHTQEMLRLGRHGGEVGEVVAPTPHTATTERVCALVHSLKPDNCKLLCRTLRHAKLLLHTAPPYHRILS